MPNADPRFTATPVGADEDVQFGAHTRSIQDKPLGGERAEEDTVAVFTVAADQIHPLRQLRRAMS